MTETPNYFKKFSKIFTSQKNIFNTFGGIVLSSVETKTRNSLFLFLFLPLYIPSRISTIYLFVFSISLIVCLFLSFFLSLSLSVYLYFILWKPKHAPNSVFLSPSCFYKSLSFRLFFFINIFFHCILSSFFLVCRLLSLSIFCPFPSPNLFWKPVFCQNISLCSILLISRRKLQIKIQSNQKLFLDQVKIKIFLPWLKTLKPKHITFCWKIRPTYHRNELICNLHEVKWYWYYFVVLYIWVNLTTTIFRVNLEVVKGPIKCR